MFDIDYVNYKRNNKKGIDILIYAFICLIIKKNTSKGTKIITLTSPQKACKYEESGVKHLKYREKKLPA